MDNDYTEYIPTLPEYLRECNARIGLNQVAFAERLGKDPSEVSKILSGKTQRPQDETLARIATIYQQAGLEVDVERLIACRDAGRGRQIPGDLPPHWYRLVGRVLAERQDIADWFYQRWAHDYEQVTALLRKQNE